MANATQAVLDVCGSNVRCIFDASQTGNLEIGMDTMQTDATNEDDQMISG